MKKINGIKKSVKEEIEEFDEKLKKQKRRRGPWKESGTELPPEERDKLFAKRLINAVVKPRQKKKRKGN
ncbi:MAG: hypothetical protein MUP16_00870 [Sedimentisphaerales bacterium]|nr:hypothetical protein [Sedimentisphaerales bacterium]